MITAETALRISLITAGDPRRLTGGNIINRRLVQALDAAWLPVEQVVLSSCEPGDAAEGLRAALVQSKPALVLLDSIALEAAAPLTVWMKQTLGARLLALMYMIPSDLQTGPRCRSLQALEAEVISQADSMVTLSEHTAQRLEALGALGRVTVILPGKDGLPAVRRPSRKGRAVRFLSVANWSPSKGIHTLVEALAHLPSGAELDLVGDGGDGDYGSQVRSLIESNRLGGRVRIHGPLSGNALSLLYAAADVFVLPSTSESFGIVFAEAMSFRLPVVACRTGPLPWLVEEGCGILVPPDDAPGLAGALETLASDASLRRRMGRDAQQRAARLPTWQQSTATFVSLVQDLLFIGSPPQGPSHNSPQRTQRAQS